MRVLVVEDERKIARSIKKALEQEAFAVDVCYDGDTALQMVTSEPYDVAIFDRMIPGIHDGLSLVKRMREDSISTPVLFLSALGAVEDRTTGLYAGADDYLTKPFSIDELIARVRALLRRPVEQKATTLSVSDLTLDVNTHKVTRAGKYISLTNREFALLEYLVRNQGRPVSKDDIAGHVWDYEADAAPNTIEVYIKYLRDKIDKPFDKPLLHTVYGIGYRLGEGN